jgi:hypothetical protein
MAVAAFVLWVHRFTGRVPFPVRSVDGDDLAIRLLPADEVPSYWQDWRAEIEPLVARIRSTMAALAQRDSQ